MATRPTRQRIFAFYVCERSLRCRDTFIPNFSCWNELLLITFEFSAAVDQNSLRSDHVGATKGQKCTKTTEGLIFLCMSSGHVAAIAAQRCERGDLVAPTAPLCCQGHALPR